MYHPIFHVVQPQNPINMQYSIAHIFANAVLRNPLLEWQNPNKAQDPKMVEFRNKVSIEVEGLNTLEVVAEQLTHGLPQNIRKVPTEVVVTAGGKSFSEVVEYAKGTPDLPMSDEELKEKFRINASEVMKTVKNGGEKVEKAIELIYNLENVGDITEIIKLLSP